MAIRCRSIVAGLLSLSGLLLPQDSLSFIGNDFGPCLIACGKGGGIVNLGFTSDAVKGLVFDSTVDAMGEKLDGLGKKYSAVLDETLDRKLNSANAMTKERIADVDKVLKSTVEVANIHAGERLQQINDMIDAQRSATEIAALSVASKVDEMAEKRIVETEAKVYKVLAVADGIADARIRQAELVAAKLNEDATDRIQQAEQAVQVALDRVDQLAGQKLNYADQLVGKRLAEFDTILSNSTHEATSSLNNVLQEQSNNLESKAVDMFALFSMEATTATSRTQTMLLFGGAFVLFALTLPLSRRAFLRKRIGATSLALANVALVATLGGGTLWLNQRQAESPQQRLVDRREQFIRNSDWSNAIASSRVLVTMYPTDSMYRLQDERVQVLRRYYLRTSFDVSERDLHGQLRQVIGLANRMYQAQGKFDGHLLLVMGEMTARLGNNRGAQLAGTSLIHAALERNKDLGPAYLASARYILDSYLLDPVGNHEAHELLENNTLAQAIGLQGSLDVVRLDEITSLAKKLGANGTHSPDRALRLTLRELTVRTNELLGTLLARQASGESENDSEIQRSLTRNAQALLAEWQSLKQSVAFSQASPWARRQAIDAPFGAIEVLARHVQYTNARAGNMVPSELRCQGDGGLQAQATWSASRAQKEQTKGFGLQIMADLLNTIVDSGEASDRQRAALALSASTVANTFIREWGMLQTGAMFTLPHLPMKISATRVKYRCELQMHGDGDKISSAPETIVVNVGTPMANAPESPSVAGSPSDSEDAAVGSSESQSAASTASAAAEAAAAAAAEAENQKDLDTSTIPAPVADETVDTAPQAKPAFLIEFPLDLVQDARRRLESKLIGSGLTVCSTERLAAMQCGSSTGLRGTVSQRLVEYLLKSDISGYLSHPDTGRHAAINVLSSTFL